LIRDSYDSKYTWISHLYAYPEQSGVTSDHVTKKWICSYMAILFLRQYIIIPYLITMKPLDFPQIPKTQGEIKEWIDGIDIFKSFVLEHLENTELMNTLNFKFITQEWCIENAKLYPLDFFDKFKENLKAAYHNNAITLPIVAEKIAQFELKTQEIIESAITKIQKANNQNSIEEETDKWYVHGQRSLYTKDAFSETPEVHYIDFDSWLATAIANELMEGLASTFNLKKTKTYLLKPEDIFKAIDKLCLNEQFVIVAFGFNFDYFLNFLKTQELTNDKYKNIKIISFRGTRTTSSSLFLLKQSDLPNISTKEISEDVIKKLSLNKISEVINLYASVIDLNHTTKEILDENKFGKDEDEVRKSALINIHISTEIKWKKNIENIEIIQHSEYRQMGLPNSLDEVVIEIQKKKKKQKS
jgi:hypothetical protein